MSECEHNLCGGAWNPMTKQFDIKCINCGIKIEKSEFICATSTELNTPALDRAIESLKQYGEPMHTLAEALTEIRALLKVTPRKDGKV